ncbi:hypothetical protein KILIM_003_00030 [Kineosphaera limosa NBRC 100340]|uniref:Uncharacterized protein n=1 Tax=Kineosphaera limosa NBRC 100340 TaxID=1184609 RepID=K6WJW2_9MICO|nr:hypothetical protein KILIM_003_00030 [Kineosphaera limosa NBRC 100340]
MPAPLILERKEVEHVTQATPLLATWRLDDWDAAREIADEHVELVQGVAIVSPGESAATRRV